MVFKHYLEFLKFCPSQLTVLILTFNETDINPPAELGRLADASGDKRSIRRKPPLYNRCRSGKPHKIQRRKVHGTGERCEDNRRFADLFNQLYFKGQQVVDAGDLAEASEVYHGKPGEKGNQRKRDIKRRMKSGKELKILAVESQSDVNYIMPWRVMDYDCREYGKQIRGAQRANRELAREGKSVYAKDGERLSEVRKEERFAPVYTLCLYHGAEDWDGPRSLKDMMDFGEDSQGRGDEEAWRDCFADYPMRLVCANELADCSGFRTSLRELFAILFCRRDKERLKELLDRESAYQNMDEETARTLGVLMGIKGFAQNSKRYRTEKGEYDMCQEIQMFGFPGTSKLLSYPNLFFQNTESVQIQANKRFGFFILFMYMLNRL